eukprot:GFUD01103259.1.p1 GENE.GFUD01103259.1~~GFUD01103259.1.p1  ORF type:complete len:105 (-),score=21.99 GFUD01103259.1:58-372(-)
MDGLRVLGCINNGENIQNILTEAEFFHSIRSFPILSDICHCLSGKEMCPHSVLHSAMLSSPQSQCEVITTVSTLIVSTVRLYTIVLTPLGRLALARLAAFISSP